MQQQRTGRPEPAVPGHLTAGDLRHDLYVALRAVTGAAVLAPLMAANFVLYREGDDFAGLRGGICLVHARGCEQ
jgi:hypothetical protein